MENIISKFTSKLSNIWTKVLNLENCLFPEIKEELGAMIAKSVYNMQTTRETQN